MLKEFIFQLAKHQMTKIPVQSIINKFFKI
jgi:hypothetical protein